MLRIVLVDDGVLLMGHNGADRGMRCLESGTLRLIVLENESGLLAHYGSLTYFSNVTTSLPPYHWH